MPSLGGTLQARDFALHSKVSIQNPHREALWKWTTHLEVHMQCRFKLYVCGVARLIAAMKVRVYQRHEVTSDQHKIKLPNVCYYLRA